jgi:tetratricopeptide (TPR) repeat protein
MLATLALSLLVFQANPPPKPKPPPPSETAKLFFLAGDLAKAQEWARQGARRDPKVCKPLLKKLAEYAFLAGKIDEMNPAQAKQFLDLDRSISPEKPGKLTERAIERFVTKPLEIATHHARSGNPDSARVIATQVLAVDPSNAEAQALVAPTPDAGP